MRTGQFVGASSGRIARSRIRVSTASSAAHAGAMGAAAEVVGTRHATVGTPATAEDLAARVARPASASGPRHGSRVAPTTQRTHANPREATRPTLGSVPHTAASSAEPSRRQHPGQGPSASGIGASSRRRPSGTSRWSRETTRTPTARWTASAVARRSASSWPITSAAGGGPPARIRAEEARREERRARRPPRRRLVARRHVGEAVGTDEDAIAVGGDVHRADDEPAVGPRGTTDAIAGSDGERRRAKLMRGGGRLRRRE